MKRKKRTVFASMLAVSALMIAGGSVMGTAAAKSERAISEYGNTKAGNAAVSEEEALETAREDAGVKAEEIGRSRIKLEHDDGRLIYEVAFYVEKKEYDYEIDADTGEILKMDYEIEQDFRIASGAEAVRKPETDIQKLVLEKVPGASEKDLRMKLEYEDGRLVYEGDILYEEYEYEFEADAETGELISWEKESIWN